MSAPTSFGVAFFLRVAIPGLVTLLLFVPLIPLQVPIGFGDDLPGSLGLAAVLGILLTLLDTPIYRILEGRWLWPSSLRTWGTTRLEASILNLQRRALDLERQIAAERQNPQPNPARIIWLERDLGLITDSLLDFPWFGPNGEPHALWPTRFGNVLATWEYYPETRYGMDSSFYWYRLWLVLDEDNRKEIDTHWSFAQAWTYIAASAILATVVYGLLLAWFFLGTYLISVNADGNVWRVISSLLEFRPVRLPLWADSLRGLALFLFAFSGASLIVFVTAHSLALTQTRVSGEFNKTMFDLFRHEIVAVPVNNEESRAWEDAADRLRYLRGGRSLRRKWGG